MSKHILIIDDSPTIRAGLVRELEALGFSVSQAEDGQAGYEKAQVDAPDLIITDIEMPRMTGFALCDKLKASSQTRSIPVIILSSLDSDDDIEKGFQSGAAAFVTKANAKNELHQRIEEVLERAALLRERLVLVVDDSKVIREVVTRGLQVAGFRVLTAENGRQGLEILQVQKPDLILSDLQMPEMDGFAFCSALQREPEWASIPLIVMSTASDRSVIRQMVSRGAAAYLVKPFNVEQLVITAEKLLSDHFQLVLKEKERLDIERRLLLGSITSLIQALEARDRYTRGHSETVARIAVAMAQKMGFAEEELETIHLAGRMHDLGKIGIRDSVLLKPDALTKTEFSLIKKHPVIGAEILGSIPSLAPIIPGVLHHHERMDGKGYPVGLKGDAIPVLARIIAVADIYDSLTSDRPYHKRRPLSVALNIIDEATGDQLCPECVAVFLEWLDEQSASSDVADIPVEVDTLISG
ncbi:MAG: response regulator [Deltaproteobacteria bacterium]|nr:response regulator [Deltaproteobacteria bacterium]